MKVVTEELAANNQIHEIGEQKTMEASAFIGELQQVSLRNPVPTAAKRKELLDLLTHQLVFAGPTEYPGYADFHLMNRSVVDRIEEANSLTEAEKNEYSQLLRAFLQKGLVLHENELIDGASLTHVLLEYRIGKANLMGMDDEGICSAITKVQETLKEHQDFSEDHSHIGYGFLKGRIRSAKQTYACN